MLSSFYSTNSPMSPDGKVPICKNCIKSEIDETNVNSVKNMLRQIDKPFIASEWQKCLNSGKEPFGWYLRQISALPQYKNLTYDDSVDGEVNTLEYQKSNDIAITEDQIYEKPSIEILKKWGTGFSNKEYYDLEKTWSEMIRANDISTPQHYDALELYCSLKVKAKRALEADDVKTFQTLNREFNEVQKNSGFRPIDRKSGSESSGIRNFSTIWEEVETDGFIEPWDIEFSQDIVDRTIQYMLNYQLKIMNMGQLAEPPEDTPKVGE